MKIQLKNLNAIACYGISLSATLARVSLGLLCFLSVLILPACSNSRHAEVDQYINEMKARPPLPIEPVPDFKLSKREVYSVQKLRNPFERASEQSAGFKPNVNRNKEPLESYSLDALKMVGTLHTGGQLWALIMAPDGMIYKVTAGNYIGQNFGKIVSVSEKQVNIVEAVKDGNTWKHQPTSLSLVEGVPEKTDKK